MGDIKVTIDGRRGFVDEEILKGGDEAEIRAGFRVAPDASAMGRDAPGVPDVPRVNTAPDSRSWLQRTGDDTVSKARDTLQDELKRLATPGGMLKRLLTATVPPAAPAFTWSEFGEDVASGNAAKEYGEFFRGLPSLPRAAVEDPGRVLSEAVSGSVDDIVGIGARGRVRGEKLAGDSLQALGMAVGLAPLAKPAATSRRAIRGVKAPTRTPRINPRQVDRYTDALDAAAGGKAAAGRLDGKIKGAKRDLSLESSYLDEAGASRRLDDASSELDLARQAKDDFEAVQAQRKLDSVTAREVNNPGRDAMRGAKARGKRLESDLSAAVDDAFRSGRLSRRQKIELYDALKGKRPSEDLPPDLLDLAEQVREAQIDVERFRARSITDEVADPMSEHGLARTGPERAAIDKHVRDAAASKRRAAREVRDTKAKLDPLREKIDYLERGRDSQLKHVDDFEAVAENLDGSGALSWLAKQPAEGALAKHIGPAQMKAAAYLVENFSRHSPFYDVARLSAGAYGSIPPALARNVLEEHARLMTVDDSYRAEVERLSRSP